MNLKNYDPTRATSRDIFRYVAFPFENGEIGERTVLISPKALDGKSPDEVRAHVQHTYEVFRRAEEYAEAQNFTYTDEKALERAISIYSSVYLTIVANCYSVYLARLEGNDKEALTEQTYVDELNEKIDISEHIAEALSKSAEVLCKQWIEDNGPEHARRLVQAADFHMTKQVAAAAIFEADEQVPLDATDEAWRSSFEKLYRAYFTIPLFVKPSPPVQDEIRDSMICGRTPPRALGWSPAKLPDCAGRTPPPPRLGKASFRASSCLLLSLNIGGS